MTQRKLLASARHIVVEGPIGVGKTSLARRLAEHLDADTLLEQPEANPFLARFYQNRQRYALQTQLFFLFQRLDQMRDMAQPDLFPRTVISDYLMEKELLFASLTLSEDDYRLYRQIYDRVSQQAGAAPDLVIYLQARPDTLMERICKRGLDAERRITELYLEQVAERYTRYFYQYDAAPLFIVDAGQLNPVDNDEDFEMLLARLRDMRGYREFFGYGG